MVGSRGVPATFGGIEHHVEEIGSRLVDLGVEVTVYSRSNYVARHTTEHRGLRVRVLPTIGTKHLDAITHTALSTVAALRDGADIVHYHALGPGLVAPLARGGGKKVVQTIHGLDSERAKWGSGAQRLLRVGEWMSARVPHETIVVSEALRSYYEAAYVRDARMISNGVDARPSRPATTISDRFGIAPRKYLLFVGRLIPEKAPDRLVRAFRGLPAGYKLVIVGDSSFTNVYTEELSSMCTGDPNIVLPGYLHGDVLDELYSNAAVFVLPSDVEGLPLVLLEAISFGTPVVASDIAPHVEVLGNSGPGHRLAVAGSVDSLREALHDALAVTSVERAGAERLRAHVLSRYCWDEAAARTLDVYQSLLERERSSLVA
jgi:glycosyltransferase involved in cell wall biosynthesis